VDDAVVAALDAEEFLREGWVLGGGHEVFVGLDGVPGWQG
jgi:hypothetical protein